MLFSILFKLGGMDVKMRRIELNDYDFRNNLYLSVFAGVCKSKELLNEYLEQRFEQQKYGLMSSQFSVDFHIKYYDDEYVVSSLNTKMSNDIDEIFSDTAVFDLDLLKQDYPNHFDRLYNVVIIIGRLKYEGAIREIQNNKFGYFKFLGTYPELLPNKINDEPKMDKYAISKLVDWGYHISVINENRDDSNGDFYFKNHFKWKAEKDGKTFTALDPLRLLGIVTIVQEYGDAWDRIDMPNFFSIKFNN